MIIQLHEQLINKIAAGEVVERPASVLKELVENSIDAEADKIEVNIQKAGTKLIEVNDNGVGMNREDAKVASKSHTTSKISKIQDLDSIFSMGFRGEALASISSVSNVTIITKTEEEEVGTKVEINEGKQSSHEDISTKTGTTISVKHLFHNVPARRKFLKSERTEYKHILQTFKNYALAYPHIHFSLSHNKKSVYNLPSVNKESFNSELKIRINDLYGEKTSKELVQLRYNAKDIKIFGFVGHPKQARSRRSHQLIYLNKRPISSGLISKAVYEGYHGLIPKGRYPIFFLFLKIDPSEVDVNVHPRKSEVRFSSPQKIYQSVRQAAKQTLLKFLQKDTEKALKTYPQLKKHTSKSKTFTKESSKKKHFNLNKPSRKDVSKSVDFTRKLLKTSRETEDMDFSSGYKAFQVFKSFIVIEKEKKLLFIDQHAAAERVTYEKLQQQAEEEKTETQKLLIPEVVDLDKTEFETLKQYRTKLEKMGIKFNIFGKQSIKVEEIPVIIARANIEKLIEDILSELPEESDKPESFTQIQDHLFATMACHSSIRAGMKLTEEEINYLVKQLLSGENQYSCPHGRPIIWELDRKELENKFERH